jgi:predicted amidohydrolase
MSTIQPYKALALQVRCDAVNECTPLQAKEKMINAIERLEKQVKASKAFIGQDLQLVVLPEYFLSGFPVNETISEWQEKSCLEPDGEVYKRLFQVASSAGIYLSGNVYELDNHFPDLYFQSSFIINPDGKLILRYRRLNSMFAPTPHDVLSKYIGVYGEDSLFPVAQTPIGNLACMASEEILYPEIARCLVMKGAEVFLHSTSEIGTTMLSQKNIAKLARAIENMAYVVSANSAGIYGYSIPAQSTDGHSQIVNYEGVKLCEAGWGESMVAQATIHLDALRHHRQRPGMGNFLSRQRFELFANTYQQSVYPANSLLDKKISRTHFMEKQQAVIKQLKQKGIIN